MIVVQSQWKGKALSRYYDWFNGLAPDWCGITIFTGSEFKIYQPIPELLPKLREFEIEYEVKADDTNIDFLKNIEGLRKVRLNFIQRFQYDQVDAAHRTFVRIERNSKKDLIMKRWWMRPNSETWSSSKNGVVLLKHGAEEGFYSIHKKEYQRIVEEELAAQKEK
jgi:hypothetical protein